MFHNPYSGEKIMEEKQFRKAADKTTPAWHLKSGEIEPFPADDGTGIITAAVKQA